VSGEEDDSSSSSYPVGRHYLLGPLRVVHKRRAWQNEKEQSTLISLPNYSISSTTGGSGGGGKKRRLSDEEENG